MRRERFGELTGRLDLSGFEHSILSGEEGSGRPCWPVQLLVSVWIYAYSQGVSSARAIERMMEHEPGLRWLTADQVVNYHTLSDFRIRHGKALERLQVQVLGVMDQEGMLDLSTMLQDGTKVQAAAGKQSMHREATLSQRLEKAQAVVQELNQRAEQEQPPRKTAQQRRAAERVKRMQAALEELKRRQQEAPESKREQVRVSETEPDVRKMKHADGGWLPSYNLQVSTEPKHRAIISLEVTTDANDVQQMQPAVERFYAHTGRWPDRAIADNGYASRNNVEALSAQEIALLAPWKPESSREAGANQRHGRSEPFSSHQFVGDGQDGLLCPRAKPLVRIHTGTHHGLLTQLYEARAEDCQSCPAQSSCCGNTDGPRRVERVVESPATQAYLQRLQDPENQQRYKLRCAVAEFRI